WELWEMVHRVEKGGNYGWSAMEGPQPIKPEKIGPTPIRPALIELPHTIACSVTGGYVYRGRKFPELSGAYVFGDWETRRLWAGATSEHWLGLPNDSSVTLHAAGKPVPGLVYWHSFRLHFPKDAVLMRTLSLFGQRVETQLLHFEGADWRGYTFAWRDDQADAD